MPQFVPDPGVVGSLTPKVGVDAPIGQVATAQNITAAFSSVGDAPVGGTVTILYSATAGGGGPGIEVTIADGDLSGTNTGSIPIAAGGEIFRRITAESGLALNFGGYATIDLGGAATVLATLGDLKAHLEITGSADDVDLTFMIQAASDHVERSCRRRLLQQPYLAERHRSIGRLSDIVLNEWPADPAYVIVVTEGNTILDSNPGPFRLEGTDDMAPNRLVRLTDKVDGLRDVWRPGDLAIEYQAGYAQIPQALRDAVVELAAHRWNQRRDSGRSQLGLSSKSPAESSTEAYIQTLPFVADVIERYKRRVF